MDHKNYEYDFKVSRMSSDELYSDILGLWLDEIEAGYAGFELIRADGPDSDTLTCITVKDADGETHRVTADTVDKGLRLMLADDTPSRKTPGNGGKAKTFYPSTGDSARDCAKDLILGEQDCGDIDAGDADCIVQVGLYGELRYS